ncbi:M48 family metallopeptidase [Aurantiacibacter sp. D1-12]|uniref:M48 family metallopeptidase n=1 Tax=Aurantiacibacter sp. D1-12 TaxID=2993658 RepID=UPI00237D240D|nr:M48 family metallopeptidase [Aurantiacibacter sp. D1-12]MDE1467237.1 M48 family metallopeptidase [Aurantiacibacter sp. D1-12]
MTFDPAAATQAYIDTLSAEELALARDYTTGNHWLILGGLLVSALVTWLIVRSGVLDKVAAYPKEGRRLLQTFLVAVVFLIVSSLIALPWDIYTEWWRETQYGRTSQPLGDFLAQGAISLVMGAVVGGLFLLGIYTLLRLAGRMWWAWGGAFLAVITAFMLLISPSVIEPIFNDYEPIPEGEVHDAVMELAADAGVPEDRVFMFDGSRQSNNFTANVSGVGSTARIAISDVAMGEASLDEVKAVTGHEIGHYVLGHIWRTVLVISLLAMAVLFLTARAYPWFARLFGTDAEIADPRSMPVFIFVIGLFSALSQPAMNTLTRVGETEADAYSMEHVGLPDAMASALIKTAEYRYPLAGPVEETLFYTHPTVENRVRAAMDWKAANPDRDQGAAE